jgi:hypothetical protein
MVIIIGEGIGRDVHLVHKHFTIYDPGVGIFQVCASLSEGLHLGALENQSGLEFIDNKIVPAGSAVLGNYFDVFLFQSRYISFLIFRQD